MDLHEKYGLRRVINAYDKATALSGAIVLPEIIGVVAECLRHPYELDAIQEAAGRVIAEATGAEWGCVTACAAAGITLGVAASMTGRDRGKIAQLPETAGMADRVVIQKGHCISFGARVEQMIRLAGAEVVAVGDGERCTAELVRDELSRGGVAAVVAVESYHTAGYEGVPLRQLTDLAREAAVPLILDAATQELRLRELVSLGPDLIGASGHKYFSSTTAGIVAGRKELVDAVYLQNRGIGRGMKAGKEAIFGVIAALERSMQTDVDAWSAEEDRKVARAVELLAGVGGLEASVSPDPNGCPFSRVRIAVEPDVCGHSAVSLKRALAEGDPTVMVRVYGSDEGCVYLNLTEMNESEVTFACDRIREMAAKGCGSEG